MSGSIPTVLILGDHLGYQGNVKHGATTYFIHMLPALAAEGATVFTCFLREPHPAAELLRRKGIDPMFLSAGKWNPLVAFRVAALIKRYRCTVVHAAGVKATLIARVAARLAGATVIVQAHDLLPPGRVLGWLHCVFARDTDIGIGVSGAAREVVVHGYRVAPGRARVIHNGIPLAPMRQVPADARLRVRRDLSIPMGDAVILMIARMHPIKGHRTMLRIMSRVVAQCPDTVLVLAGDGPERPACEALTQTLKLERNLRFLGSRDDVPELLAACDVVVAPSESEGFPTVAIEAGASGRPVIGFDRGGLRDIITHGISGCLIEPEDEAGFAAALVELLTDQSMRRRLGKAGRSGVQRFTVEQHVRALIECYRDAARASPARRRPSGGSHLLAAVHDAWRKNLPEVAGLMNRALPKFIIAREPADSCPGVPVFCYHLVDKNGFRSDLEFLKNNGYATLGAEDFLRYLQGTTRIASRSVLLTFDDGPRNFYDVAFPLLREFNARAMAFVAPGLHADGDVDDRLLARPMTWDEISEIHASGLVAFQSHTLESRCVPQWPAPAALVGCPPWLESSRRSAVALDLREDLLRSQAILRERLSGATINHLSFPQYVGTPQAIDVARSIGFEACYWGYIPNRPLNIAGRSPFFVSRLSDEFLRRLPGDGRISVPALLTERLRRIRTARASRRNQADATTAASQSDPAESCDHADAARRESQDVDILA